MKNKKILLMMCTLMMGMSVLTSCGKTEEKTEEKTEKETETEVETEAEVPEEEVKEETSQETEGLEKLRQDMEPSAAIAGVFFLGVSEEDLSGEGLMELLDESGYTEGYDYLREIPESNFVSTDGAEVYCIIPADPDAAVTITTWDETETAGEPGAELYHSDKGEPVIVKGNASDIMPNFAVTVTDSYGNKLNQYHPRISLKDGKVITPEDPEPIVLDYTIYDY